MKPMKHFITAGVAAVLIAIMAATLLGGCSQITNTGEPSPNAAVSAMPTEEPQPTEQATMQPTSTPIKTTQPLPEPAAIATISVSEGDMLERDIIPQLVDIFALSEDEVKSALAACPDSSLISSELEDYRRMEGVIVPGEYKVFEGDTLEEYVVLWVAQAQARYNAVTASVEQPNGLSAHERLILASIIESECLGTPNHSEVAAVFLNRLSDGMKLQSCVTSEYAIGFNRPFLLTVDVKTQSPYNTYYTKALPIGPISVVSELSLLAASGVSTDTETIFFFYNYVENDMFFFAEYADFKREAAISRQQFESTMDMDPHEIIDKRDYFGK